jgi:hypothetical protein
MISVWATPAKPSNVPPISVVSLDNVSTPASSSPAHKAHNAKAVSASKIAATPKAAPKDNAASTSSASPTPAKASLAPPTNSAEKEIASIAAQISNAQVHSNVLMDSAWTTPPRQAPVKASPAKQASSVKMANASAILVKTSSVQWVASVALVFVNTILV